jgi:hypothetical protein
MADADKIMFNKIITGDKVWCFAYDPETKRQNSAWVGETPSAEGTEIPKVPHQNHIDIFFPTLKA